MPTRFEPRPRPTPGAFAFGHNAGSMEASCDILHGDCLAVLPTLPAACASLIYVDPPFNTGREQSRDRMRVVEDEGGTRSGFGGKRYRVESVESPAYGDDFGDD